MRRTVFAALEIRDEAEILGGLDRGELETRVLQGERVRAAAPADVSIQLRLTAQAEADAHRQAAEARAQHDHAGAASAAALAAQMAAARQRLEANDARYEQWSADTHAARKAAAELQRRGHAQPDHDPHPQPEDKPQQMAGWWQQLEVDAEAMNCVDASEHQAARDTGNPQPPQRVPENERAARFDELLSRADQAAQRIAAQQAERQASSEYAARMEREAQHQAEAEQQAQARDELELEL